MEDGPNCERFETRRTVGYIIVGVILCVAGAVMMALASTVLDDYYLPSNEAKTYPEIRHLFKKDRIRDSVFSAGIAILASGVLMLFGFGLTNLFAERLGDQK